MTVIVYMFPWNWQLSFVIQSSKNNVNNFSRPLFTLQTISVQKLYPSMRLTGFL